MTGVPHRTTERNDGKTATDVGALGDEPQSPDRVVERDRVSERSCPRVRVVVQLWWMIS